MEQGCLLKDDAINQARQVVSDLEKAASMAEAAKNEAAAKEAEQAQSAADARDAADPIKVAIKNRRIIIGMTIPQAREALGQPDDFKIVQTANGETDYVAWTSIKDVLVWHARFEGGVATVVTVRPLDH